MLLVFMTLSYVNYDRKYKNGQVNILYMLENRTGTSFYHYKCRLSTSWLWYDMYWRTSEFPLDIES